MTLLDKAVFERARLASTAETCTEPETPLAWRGTNKKINQGKKWEEKKKQSGKGEKIKRNKGEGHEEHVSE